MHAAEDVQSRCNNNRTRENDKVRTSRRNLIEWILVVLIAVGLMIAYVSLARGADTHVASTREVLVEAGDTLWSLARNNPVPGWDTAQTVASSVHSTMSTPLRSNPEPVSSCRRRSHRTRRRSHCANDLASRTTARRLPQKSRPLDGCPPYILCATVADNQDVGVRSCDVRSAVTMRPK
jgi:hypothetical protein